MRRLIIVYNSRSSRFSDVKKDVLAPAKELKGYLVGKYEVEKTDLEDNINKFSKLIQEGDLIVSAGGDATGIIASNGILKSGKNATLAVLPYGNFNDLSRALGTKTFDEVIEAEKAHKPTTNFYPLEVTIDGKFFRYATCYVTIGMTAEAVELYNNPAMRRKLRKSFGRHISSYTKLASWYFKNRHKKQFIPEFKLNGVLQHKKTSDYAAVNGRSMARVMKGGEDYKNPKIFRSETDRLAGFWRLFKLMFKSVLFRIPGSETTLDVLSFEAPATLAIQTEGEHKLLKNVHEIKIRKGEKCLKAIEN